MISGRGKIRELLTGGPPCHAFTTNGALHAPGACRGEHLHTHIHAFQAPTASSSAPLVSAPANTINPTHEETR